MKKYFYLFATLLFSAALFAQKPVEKTFWKEDFNGGKIPAGWQVITLNDSASKWFVTDQPFPGSPGRNYQAPPIASASRGYHLQVAPGVRVDKNSRSWKKINIWPDSYVQTPAIDCSAHRSVVLKFQQNFFWNRRDADKGAGLYVGVSTNAREWTYFSVKNEIGSGEDCPNPMDIELNITRLAAGQKNVWLKFFWKGYYQWYWMVDDISLSEAFDADVLAYRLISHPETGNQFGAADNFKFQIINLGSNDIIKDFDCYLKIDNRPLLKTTVKADAKKPFKIIDTLTVAFPGNDLTDFGIHKIRFNAELPGDLRLSNDTIATVLYSGAFSLGDVTAFKTVDGGYEFKCGNALLKMQFVRKDIFRLWMAYDGEYTDPAGNDIVINKPDQPVEVKSTDKGSYYLFTTPELALRAYKKPLRFALYKADNSSLIWEEAKGMTYGKQTVQYLKRQPNEYFYGGGMQNGRFSHRDKTIKLTIDYNWEDGGGPNPAPFFMSTAGYGALRNTYASGAYSFGDTIKLIHNEARFDSYFFAGNGLKDILGDYTDITGKPFLMPRWALSMGDANCYNRGAKADIKTTGSKGTGFGGTTPDVINIIADEYIKHDMPRGWILPNDGYGCGYTKLDSVVKELYKRGFYTGLWTENGVEKIAKEVGELGSRLCKLDVAWVGDGYKFAIDGVKAAYEGIENASDARGFVWSVCGWAGTHRHSVVWTGDQSGSWNYIRWHIPTLIGSGLSAQNSATGDVDGIFGGSDSTYTRDLQWKCFTPVLMGMSGWASNNKNGIKDKQPWLFGEPFTSINRKYLQLKQRMTPFMYTLCAESNHTGVPAVRGLVLEYPTDPVALGSLTQYEYLLGRDLLVAPVYKSEAKRDSIYFPAGNWIDYWDGTIYQGNQWISNYPAPLEKLPLFVRSGAIVPMYQKMFFDWERPTDTLTLDIYPNGKSEFEMYEDDGLTREHRKGVFATTRFEVIDNRTAGKPMEIVINPAQGNFNGRLTERVYLLEIHSTTAPKLIKNQGLKVKGKVSKKGEGIEKKQIRKKGKNGGWSFDPNDRGGIIRIWTGVVSTDSRTTITVQ
jgi:alpha-glucosidase (family GH31 glycosyl hydrolase)